MHNELRKSRNNPSPRKNIPFTKIRVPMKELTSNGKTLSQIFSAYSESKRVQLLIDAATKKNVNELKLLIHNHKKINLKIENDQDPTLLLLAFTNIEKATVCLSLLTIYNQGVLAKILNNPIYKSQLIGSCIRKGNATLIKAVLKFYPLSNLAKELNYLHLGAIEDAIRSQNQESLRLVLDYYAQAELLPLQSEKILTLPSLWLNDAKTIQLIFDACSQEALDKAWGTEEDNLYGCFDLFLQKDYPSSKEKMKLLLISYCRTHNIEFKGSKSEIKQKVIDSFIDDFSTAHYPHFSTSPEALKTSPIFLSLVENEVIPFFMERLSARLLAKVVMINDEYLRITPNSNKPLEKADPIRHLYQLLIRFPYDIQMVFCNRLYGIANDIVSGKDMEDAFIEEFTAFQM